MGAATLLVSGGIGSGKSFVIKTFNALGVPSYDADSRARGLYDSDPELLSSVVALAGEEILSDGKLDRRALASLIFTSPELKAGVESLVHPAVMRDFFRWRDSRTEPLVIMESAILPEHHELLEQMDYSLAVTAPLELRIRRVMERDGASREKVLERIACQWSDAKRLAVSDFTIVNDGVQPILPQIIEILDRIKAYNGKN
ncbi:MAG: dephospho-CoA kinase [Bacteroidales bacterium]|nr:dephospho-CoA kinase [Bacteroidales bacterium]